MNYFASKHTKSQSFYLISVCFFLLLLFARAEKTNSTSRIYLIRHATVDLKKPGWGTSKKSEKYKEAYNFAGIEAFDPDKVLRKIENHKRLDTVFCSPLPRAQQTAEILFYEHIVLHTDSVLAELDYPVVRVPALHLPVKGWLWLSRFTWMAGINRGEKTSYKKRLDELSAFSDELLEFAHKNELAVVVAHGMVNHELIRILKKRGWEYCENGKDGFGNLSVQCLEYNS